MFKLLRYNIPCLNTAIKHSIQTSLRYYITKLLKNQKDDSLIVLDQERALYQSPFLNSRVFFNLLLIRTIGKKFS